MDDIWTIFFQSKIMDLPISWNHIQFLLSVFYSPQYILGLFLVILVFWLLFKQDFKNFFLLVFVSMKKCNKFLYIVSCYLDEFIISPNSFFAVCGFYYVGICSRYTHWFFFNHELMFSLSNAFSMSIEMILWLFAFPFLIQCVTLICVCWIILETLEWI